MSEFPCKRCGELQRTVEVTAFGDAEPRLLPTGCPCPRPHCPFCHGVLDPANRCLDIDCFMLFQVIPVPEMT